MPSDIEWYIKVNNDIAGNNQMRTAEGIRIRNDDEFHHGYVALSSTDKQDIANRVVAALRNSVAEAVEEIETEVEIAEGLELLQEVEDIFQELLTNRYIITNSVGNADYLAAVLNKLHDLLTVDND